MVDYLAGTNLHKFTSDTISQNCEMFFALFVSLATWQTAQLMGQGLSTKYFKYQR